MSKNVLNWEEGLSCQSVLSCSQCSWHGFLDKHIPKYSIWDGKWFVSPVWCLLFLPEPRKRKTSMISHMCTKCTGCDYFFFFLWVSGVHWKQEQRSASAAGSQTSGEESKEGKSCLAVHGDLWVLPRFGMPGCGAVPGRWPWVLGPGPPSCEWVYGTMAPTWPVNQSPDSPCNQHCSAREMSHLSRFLSFNGFIFKCKRLWDLFLFLRDFMSSGDPWRMAWGMNSLRDLSLGTTSWYFTQHQPPKLRLFMGYTWIKLQRAWQNLLMLSELPSTTFPKRAVETAAEQKTPGPGSAEPVLSHICI